MAAITCDVCGGNSLTMTDDGQYSVCDFCGTKHTLERIRAKVQEIKGVVEVTKGEAEKERLLVNAATYLKLKDTTKALEIYRILTNEYPNDFNTWIGLAKCYFAQLEPIYGKEELSNLNTPLFAALIDAEKKATLLCPEAKSTFDTLWQKHQSEVDTYSASLIMRYRENDYFGDILSILTYREYVIPNSHKEILDILKSNATNFICKLSHPNLLERIKSIPLEYVISRKYFKQDKYECIDIHSRVINIEYLSCCDVLISCKSVVGEEKYYVRFKKPYTISELINAIHMPSEEEQKRIDGILTLETYLRNMPDIKKWILSCRFNHYKEISDISIYNINIQKRINVLTDFYLDLTVVYDYSNSIALSWQKAPSISHYRGESIRLTGNKSDIEDMRTFCKINNLCIHCGGRFEKSNRTCSKCGSKKNY